VKQKMSTPPNKFASSKGMSVTEFVIIAPVLMLCLYGSLEINDRIEAKNAMIVSNRLAKVLPKKGGGLNNAGDETKKRVLDNYVNNQLQISALAKETPIPEVATGTATPTPHPDSGLSAQEKLMQKKGGWGLEITSEAQTRSAGGQWETYRNAAMSPLPFPKQSANTIYEMAAKWPANATKAIQGILDHVKGDSSNAISIVDAIKDDASLPAFISDKNSTLRHTMSMRQPEGSGAWSTSLNLLSEMVTKTSGPAGKSEKVKNEVTAFLISESETGYHPSNYRAGSIVGLIWGLSMANVQHWGEERWKRPVFSLSDDIPEKGFSASCPYFYQADSNCIYSKTGANSYVMLVQVVKIVSIIKSVFSTIYSGNAAEIAGQIALDQIFDFAIEEIKDEIIESAKDAAKKKIEEQIQQQVENLKNKAVEAFQTQLEKINPLKANCLLESSLDEKGANTSCQKGL
jgi:hypothetical protein